MGRKSKNGGIYVYIWPIHFAVQEKLIHCRFGAKEFLFLTMWFFFVILLQMIFFIAV